MKGMDFEKKLVTSIIPETKEIFDLDITNCKTNLIEHRLDGLVSPKNFEVNYNNYDFAFLVTLRPQNPKAHNYLTENERIQLLKQSIDNGAKMVDIEVETEKTLVEELIQFAKEKQVTTILSYHNYTETPGKEILEKIVQSMFKTEVDIVKCVTLANDYTDAHRIIDLQIKWSEKIIAFAMGKFGSYSRILSLIHGAPIAYVPLNMKTAPGQLSLENFKTIYKLLS